MPGATKKLTQIWNILSNKNVSSSTAVSVTGSTVDTFGEIKLELQRSAKYTDYEEMDDSYGQIYSTALDAYADYCLRRDFPSDYYIKVVAENVKIAEVIKDINHRLGLEEENLLWSWIRTECKFGDLFVEIVYDGRGDLVDIVPLDSGSIFWNMNNRGRVNKEFPYVQKDIDGQVIAQFRGWQIVHFSLLRDATDYYGHSILQPVRLPHRQLKYMEDSLFLQRVTKRRRLVHKVDITDKTPIDAQKFMDNYKEDFKKKLTVDPTTGNFSFITNRPFMEEDYYFGVSKETSGSTGLEVLKDAETMDITDIEYFSGKIVSSLKIPKERLNIDVKGARNVGTNQNFFFASTIRRIQLSFLMGLYKIYDVSLLKKGIDITQRKNDYTLSLPRQNTTDELIKARVDLIRSTAAKNYIELGVLDRDAVIKKFLDLDAEAEKKLIARMQKVADEKAKEQEKLLKASQGNDDGGDDKNDKDKNDKDKNFNKTGKGSAPVRITPAKKSNEELIAIVKNDPVVVGLLGEIREIMKEEKVFKRKKQKAIDIT